MEDTRRRDRDEKGLLNAIQEYLEEKSIAICVDEDEE